jgi:hypothetical protein
MKNFDNSKYKYDLNYKNEDYQITEISHSPFSIRHIDNPSEKLQLIAVTQNPYAIQFIKHPTEKVQLEAVSIWGESIKHIQSPSKEAQLVAVKILDSIYYNLDEYIQKITDPEAKDLLEKLKNVNKVII